MSVHSLNVGMCNIDRMFFLGGKRLLYLTQVCDQKTVNSCKIERKQ